MKTNNRYEIFLSMLGIAWFWLLFTVFVTQLNQYSVHVLHANTTVSAVLISLFLCGTAVSSFLSYRLSAKQTELGLVPLGSIGLTLFGIDLFFASNITTTASAIIDGSEFMHMAGSYRIILDLLMLGVSGGLYLVPLYTYVQQRSDITYFKQIRTWQITLNILFAATAIELAFVLLMFKFSIPQLILTFAILNALVAIYIFSLVPEFLMRFIVWLLIHSIYRVNKAGLDNIPKQGAALLVCNHVSYVDALVIAGCIRRPVRFVAWYKFYNLPVLNFIFRTAKAIPIASRKEDPEMLENAYARIATELEAGNLVCIFPEGKLTKTGEMNSFQPGLKKILARNPVPVVPMALRGLWGSAFSRKAGNFCLTLLRRFWSRVELVISSPVAPQAVRLESLQETVLQMRGDYR